MIRAVIDTNVLVSAMISSAGNEALLVLAINQGLITPCLSTEIIKEYGEVLLRPKFGFGAGEVEALIDLLRGRGSLLDPFPIGRPIRVMTNSLLAPFRAKLNFSRREVNDISRRTNTRMPEL